MNQDKALELLKDGKVDEWNTLRQSGESIPNLSGAKLIEADLSRARGHGKEIVMGRERRWRKIPCRIIRSRHLTMATILGRSRRFSKRARPNPS